MGEVMIENEEKLDKCTQNIKTLVRAIDIEFGNVTVNSGYRSVEHNNLIGGAKNSMHTTGMAVDISIPNVHVIKIASWLLYNIKKYPWTRMSINIFKNYIHVDEKKVKSIPEIHLYDRNNKWL